MGLLGGLLGSIFGDGDDAADAATDAASIAASAEQDKLDYLKEINELPQELKEEALQQLQQLFDMTGEDWSQEAMIERASQSPIFQQIMSNQQAGEDSLLRTEAATGGLRSGNLQDAMFKFSTQLKNNALLEGYNQERNQYLEKLGGLKGLAQLPTNENQIAAGMSNIGSINASGVTAAAQAQETGSQNNINNLLGLGSLATQIPWSDRRLKKDIEFLFMDGKHRIYRWNWNDRAKKDLGLVGSGVGVIADEAFAVNPKSVMWVDGYEAIDYKQIGEGYGS